MIRHLLLIFASLATLAGGLGVFGQAHSQVMSGNSVSGCGSPTYIAGFAYPVTLDTSGRLCVNNGGSGGSTAVTAADCALITIGCEGDTVSGAGTTTYAGYLGAGYSTPTIVGNVSLRTGAALNGLPGVAVGAAGCN